MMAPSPPQAPSAGLWAPTVKHDLHANPREPVEGMNQFSSVSVQSNSVQFSFQFGSRYGSEQIRTNQLLALLLPAAAAAAAATAAACIFGWTAWTNTVKAEIPARTLVRWPGLDAQSVPKRHDVRIRHLLARPQTLQNHFHWLGPPVPPPDPFGGPSRGLCPPIGGPAGPRRSRQAIPKGPQAAPGPPRRPPAAPPFGGP